MEAAINIVYGLLMYSMQSREVIVICIYLLFFILYVIVCGVVLQRERERERERERKRDLRLKYLFTLVLGLINCYR